MLRSAQECRSSGPFDPRFPPSLDALIESERAQERQQSYRTFNNCMLDQMAEFALDVENSFHQHMNQDHLPPPPPPRPNNSRLRELLDNPKKQGFKYKECPPPLDVSGRIEEVSSSPKSPREVGPVDLPVDSSCFPKSVITCVDAPSAPKKSGRGYHSSKKAGDWICSRCNAHNYSLKTACYKCNLGLAEQTNVVSVVPSGGIPTIDVTSEFPPPSIISPSVQLTQISPITSTLNETVSEPGWHMRSFETAVSSNAEVSPDVKSAVAIEVAEKNLMSVNKQFANLDVAISMKKSQISKLQSELAGMEGQQAMLGQLCQARQMEVMSVREAHVVLLDYLAKSAPQDDPQQSGPQWAYQASIARIHLRKVQEQSMIGSIEESPSEWKKPAGSRDDQYPPRPCQKKKQTSKRRSSRKSRSRSRRGRRSRRQTSPSYSRSRSASSSSSSISK